jgi:hypothetical protein
MYNVLRLFFMKKLLIIIIFAVTLLGAEFKNSLQHENSPYLKQHENNPVQWMRWGDSPF